MPNTLFKKNTPIALIKSWDDRGTVFIRRGTVQSCGKTLLRVRLANGKMQQHLYIKDLNTSIYATHIIPDTGTHDLQAYGIQLAEKFLIAERCRLTACLNANDDNYKRRATRRDLELLHKPRIEWR